MKWKKILLMIIAIVLVLEVVFPVLKINFNDAIARDLEPSEKARIENKGFVATVPENRGFLHTDERIWIWSDQQAIDIGAISVYKDNNLNSFTKDHYVLKISENLPFNIQLWSSSSADYRTYLFFIDTKNNIMLSDIVYYNTEDIVFTKNMVNEWRKKYKASDNAKLAFRTQRGQGTGAGYVTGYIVVDLVENSVAFGKKNATNQSENATIYDGTMYISKDVPINITNSAFPSAALNKTISVNNNNFKADKMNMTVTGDGPIGSSGELTYSMAGFDCRM